MKPHEELFVKRAERHAKEFLIADGMDPRLVGRMSALQAVETVERIVKRLAAEQENEGKP